MSLSVTLDIAVGLSLVFAILSLFASAVQEALASTLRSRARFLTMGIENLLGRMAGREGRSLAADILNHGLLQGSYQPIGELRRRFAADGPSYIEPRIFALALIDALPSQDGDRPLVGIGAKVAALPAGPLRSALNVLVAEANGDVNVLIQNVAAWFESTMSRVSGWYKRRAQLALFSIGLVIAIGFNVDTIALVKHLAVNNEARRAITAYADEWLRTNEDALKQAVAGEAAAAQSSNGGAPEGAAEGQSLDSSVTALGAELARLPLPVGYPAPLHWSLGSAIIGWLMTALATSLGAPFWLHSLRGLARVTGAGQPSVPGEVSAFGPGVAAATAASRVNLGDFESRLLPDEVRDLQAVLGLSGEYATGELDARTREAIVAWEQKHRYKSTGILSADVYAHIMRV